MIEKSQPTSDFQKVWKGISVINAPLTEVDI